MYERMDPSHYAMTLAEWSWVGSEVRLKRKADGTPPKEAQALD
jgi:hypothetical protein